MSGGLRNAVALAAAALSLGFCAGARADDSDLVKRGEYLMRAGDCVASHTAPNGQPFAGGRRMDTPFGPIYTPNITPDKATGIGDWTDDDFYRAMHEGIRKDGKYLYPVFPFPWYTNVSKQDVLAIKAYLFTVTPVHAPDQGNRFSFPFNIREALLTWRTAFFKVAPAQPAPDPADKVARGAYLVNGLGHCGECHNKENLFGASDWSGKFEGGQIEDWYAPNITPDGKQGVGAWSEDDIAKYLKTGIGPHSNVALGPMQETIDDSLRYLTDDDLHAMAAYLKSVKPKETFANNEGGYSQKGAPGQALYQTNCASCHQLNGQGVPGKVPALAHNGAVVAGGPQDVIHIVLAGQTARDGLAPMPAVGADLTDAQVAEVADYVRNAFGNAAPAGTKPSLVADIRAKTFSPMLASRNQDCGAPNSSEVKALVSDGTIDKIATGNAVNLLPSIDGIVAKLNPGDVKQASAFVADLTSAYCAALVKADATVKEPQRADAIGKFATLAYSRMETRLAQQ